MEFRPIIYSAKLSSQNVTTKTKITITVVTDDIETYYATENYAKSSNYEVIAGEEIGVI